ncbi:MAG: AMP-binding protein [Pseudomonadota bacterium]
MLDRVGGRVLARVADSEFRAWLLELTVSTGMTCYEARRDGHPFGIASWVLYKILGRLVARSILAALGGRVRLVVAGGAPLSEDVARFFLGLGLPLTEGYGLTETSSAACAARRGLYWPGTVGTPLDGVSVRLGADDEILIKSPGQMLGYWRNETQTRAALVDGWLRTGDVGAFENGQLRIVGRLKDLIVLSTGEKLSPAQFEIAIAQDDLIATALLIGGGLSHAVALTVLDADLWREAVTALNLPVDPSSLGRPEFEAALLARIKARMAGAPRYAEVRAVHATLDAWTVENGLLTPTMKPKRGEIARRYAREVQAAAARAAATSHRQMD